MHYVKVTIRDVHSSDTHEIGILPGSIVTTINRLTDREELVKVDDLRPGDLIGKDNTTNRFEILAVDI